MYTTTATTSSTTTSSNPFSATRVTLSTSQPSASPSKATPVSTSTSLSQKEGEEEEKEEEEERDDDVYDEIEIEDMTFDAALHIYHYPCPCGDRFEISVQDLREERTDIAVCPGCSLRIRVIYEVEDLPAKEDEGEAG